MKIGSISIYDHVKFSCLNFGLKLHQAWESKSVSLPGLYKFAITIPKPKPALSQINWDWLQELILSSELFWNATVYYSSIYTPKPKPALSHINWGWLQEFNSLH